MPRFAFLIWLLSMLPSLLAAQTRVDSTELLAFRKGRNQVGLNGSISSSFLSNANAGSGNNQLGNSYRFDIRLGKFLADKNAAGLMFVASRTHLVGYINSKAEVMGIGPWYRLYLGRIPNIAFYLQPHVLYANYFGESDGVQAFFSVDEELDLAGIRAGLGIGVSYVLDDRVSFDVGVEYTQARFWGSFTDNYLSQEYPVALNRAELVFSFGFTVLFERLRRDE